MAGTKLVLPSKILNALTSVVNGLCAENKNTEINNVHFNKLVHTFLSFCFYLWTYNSCYAFREFQLRTNSLKDIKSSCKVKIFISLYTAGPRDTKWTWVSGKNVS